jgi:hypothetical protein
MILTFALDIASTLSRPSPTVSTDPVTKMAEAVAPVSFTASLTLAKTGRSRCVVPAFLGLILTFALDIASTLSRPSPTVSTDPVAIASKQ